MSKLLAMILLFLRAIAGWAQPGPSTAYVRQIDYVVQSFAGGEVTSEAKALFLLYMGNPETERLDRLAERSGAVWTICLVHPVRGPESPSGTRAGGASPADARSQWYVTENDTRRGIVRRAPLLDRATWRGVPVPARRALLALGPQDKDLILISWNGISGSLSVFFAPSLQEDRAFHERKLETLKKYLDTYGSNADEPFDPVSPLGTVTL